VEPGEPDSTFSFGGWPQGALFSLQGVVPISGNVALRFFLDRLLFHTEIENGAEAEAVGLADLGR
jgi:hypothetical protein